MKPLFELENGLLFSIDGDGEAGAIPRYYVLDKLDRGYLVTTGQSSYVIYGTELIYIPASLVRQKQKVKGEKE